VGLSKGWLLSKIPRLKQLVGWDGGPRMAPVASGQAQLLGRWGRGQIKGRAGPGAFKGKTWDCNGLQPKGWLHMPMPDAPVP
jgi:hypothetical protein